MPAQSTEPLGDSLLKLARQAINSHFGQPTATFTVDQPELQKSGASFVTLTQNGQLRGCIGSLQAWRPLAQDVQQNALAAALRDPRFKPLTAEELARTRVEVSLLTAPEPMQFSSEADLLGQLRPGVDGIIFSAGPHRATFLPQVWEQLPTPQAFMAQLKRKAGLAADYWGDEVRIERYGVQKWKENAC
ncbi:MAG: AmmeMemoRadiSam system protein A [Rhodocyclales bacterium]|nr:AmmeMemoRadiSam system protein A [Rhodocyclales bacterium]